MHVTSMKFGLNHSDYLLKVLLIGNSGVGKTCILMRYAVWI